MRALICLLFFLCSAAPACRAATYYVDSGGGRDSNAGTCKNGPWKSIARVNGRAFQPGDRILFKRGDLWRETLVPPSSGIAGRPIIFGAYGTGHKPVIKASGLITGWRAAAHMPDVRAAKVPVRPFVVWENNSALMPCRSLSEAEANTGSFYWDSGTLYVRATSGYPDTNGKAYEAAHRTDSCRIENRRYLVIRDIDFVQSGNNGGVGLRIVNASNHIIIDSCDFSQAADQHLAIWGNLPKNGDYTISGCTFEWSGLRHVPGSGSAIDVLSTGSNNITITGQCNTFSHVGGSRAAPHLDHGIYLKSGRLVWRYNYHRSGGKFSGACVKISGRAKDGCEIHNNVFSAGSGGQPLGVLSEAGSGHTVYNNLFYNVDTGVWQSGRNGPYVAGGSGIRVENNIFYKTRCLFLRAEATTNFTSDHNVFFDVRAGKTKKPFRWGRRDYSLAGWEKKSGEDAHSLTEASGLTPPGKAGPAGPNCPAKARLSAFSARCPFYQERRTP